MSEILDPPLDTMITDFDPSKSVMISNLPGGLPLNMMEVFLRQRGGTFEKLHFSSENSTAVVQFCRDEDADKFTSKTQKMGQTELAVTWFEESELGSRTVELSGLKMLHTQDILQDYFNDKKLNTESIDVDTASNTATVIFSLIKDAIRFAGVGVIDYGGELKVRRIIRTATGQVISGATTSSIQNESSNKPGNTVNEHDQNHKHEYEEHYQGQRHGYKKLDEQCKDHKHGKELAAQTTHNEQDQDHRQENTVVRPKTHKQQDQHNKQDKKEATTTDAQTCVIEVMGIAMKHRRLADSFFNKKKASCIKHDGETTTVTFQSQKAAEAAEAVLSLGILTPFEGASWTVKYLTPQDKQDIAKGHNHDNKGVKSDIQTCLVEVIGIGVKQRKFANSFFSKKRASDIKHGEELTTVIFQNEEDAEAIRNIGNFTPFAGVNWTVKSPISKEEEKPSAVTEFKIIKVKTSVEIDPEFLPVFLEDVHDAVIVSLEEGQEPQTFIVTFQESEDALHFVETGHTDFDGITLEYSPHYSDSTSICMQKSTSKSALVEGLPEDMSAEDVQLYFEDVLDTEDGEITEVRKTKDGMALTFKNIEDCKKICGQVRDVDGVPVSVSQLEISPAIPSCAVEVTMDSEISEEKLLLYFESSRYSGGGEIESTFMMENNRAVITFKDESVADKVAGKKSIIIDEVKFTINKLESDLVSRMISGSADQERFLVRGLSDHCNRSDLVDFMDQPDGCKVRSIMYGPRPGVALVRFKGAPDFCQLQQLCFKKPLCEKLLTIERVEIPRAIQVTIPQTLKKNTLKYYFNNEKRSGGKNVTNVTLYKDDGCAVIGFQDPKVVKEVLGKPHILEKTQLILQYYFHGIGIIPPNHDTSKPSISMPKFVTKTVPEDIIRFWRDKIKHSSKIDEVLQKIGAKVVWKECTEKEIKIVPQLDKTSDHQEVRNRWSERVRLAAADILSIFAVEKVQCLQDAWKTVVSQAGDLIKEINKTTSDDVILTIDDSNNTFIIAGVKQEVDTNSRLLHDLHAKTVRQMEKDKQSINQSMTIAKPKLELLILDNRIRDIENLYGVECKITDDTILLAGLPDAIKSARVDVYEFMTDLRDIDCDTPDGAVHLLNKCSQQLKDKLRNENMKMSWDAKGNSLCCYASKHEVTKVKLFMKELFVEEKYHLPKTGHELINNTEWTVFTTALEKKCGGCLSVTKSGSENTSITVLTSNDHIGVVHLEMQNYLKENLLIQKSIKLRLEQVKVVENDYNRHIQHLIHIHGPDKVEMKTLKFQPNIGFELQAPQGVMEQLMEKLDTITTQIKRKVHSFTSPGITAMLQDNKVRAFLDTVESNHHVAITIGLVEEVTELPDLENGKGKRKSKKDQSPNVVCCGRLGQNTKLCVAKGDMLKMKVDAIVNAANEDLLHIGGLAKAVVDAGGVSIQEECSQYVKDQGRILVGDVFVSRPGTLACTNIIHAVGPRWGAAAARVSHKQLKGAVCEVLNKATEMKMSTVAIPALSMGVFGYPVKEGTENIVESITSFFEDTPQTTLREIYLVDVSDRNVNAFQTALQNSTSIAMTPVVNRPDHDPYSKPFTEQIYDHVVGSGASAFPSSEDYVFVRQPPEHNFQHQTSAHIPMITTNEGLKITLKRGQIESLQVDAIVNSSSKTFQLGQGALSSAILKAAGQSIQRECAQQVKGVNIGPGQVVETSAGQLPCRRIYHGYLQSWDHRGSSKQPAEAILSTYMKNCLFQAHRSKLTSIAFPPLGTGVLGMPDVTAVSSMLDEVKEFSRSNPVTTLKEVIFIIHQPDQNKYDSFEDIFQNGGARKKLMQNPNRSSKIIKTGKDISVDIGGVNMLVTKGDITDETSDIILSITDDSFSLSRGIVEKTIAKKGGATILQELQNPQLLLTPNQTTTFRMTSSGNLSCGGILHYGRDVNYPQWDQVVCEALQEADRNKATTFSIPAVGTGHLNMSGDGSALSILKGIQRFTAAGRPRYLREVRCVLFDSSMHKSFKKAIEKAFSPTSKGILGSIWDYVTGNKSEDPGHTETPTEDLKYNTIDTEKHITIWSLAEENETSAFKAITQYFKSETETIVIDDEEDQELIKKLTEKQIESIRMIEKELDVTIELKNTQYLTRIIIRGYNRQISKASDRVKSMLRNVERRERLREREQSLVKTIQWEVDDGDGSGNFTKYAPELNLKIETAHENKENKVSWTAKGVELTIDLKRSVLTSPLLKTPHKVKRRVLGRDDQNVPDHWDKMAAGDPPRCVLLSPQSREYQDVETEITSTSNRIQVKQIHRIQNTKLWKQFSILKETMKNSQLTQSVERRLWHGTKKDSVENIYVSGLDRGFHGSNATMYGNGVYFATAAAYSARPQYSVPDPQSGDKHIFLCKVLTGDFCQGTQGLKSTPDKDVTVTPKTKYDSVVDDINNPNIFVIFNDTQAYPEYLIIC